MTIAPIRFIAFVAPSITATPTVRQIKVTIAPFHNSVSAEHAFQISISLMNMELRSIIAVLSAKS